MRDFLILLGAYFYPYFTGGMQYGNISDFLPLRLPGDPLVFTFLAFLLLDNLILDALVAI